LLLLLELGSQLLLLLLELRSQLLWLLLESTGLQLRRGPAAEGSERSLLWLLLYWLEAKLDWRRCCCTTVCGLLRHIRGSGCCCVGEGLLSRTGLEGLLERSRRGAALRCSTSRSRSQGTCRSWLSRCRSNLEGIGVKLGWEGFGGRPRSRGSVTLL